MVPGAGAARRGVGLIVHSPGGGSPRLRRLRRYRPASTTAATATGDSAVMTAATALSVCGSGMGHLVDGDALVLPTPRKIALNANLILKPCPIHPTDCAKCGLRVPYVDRVTIPTYPASCAIYGIE